MKTEPWIDPIVEEMHEAGMKLLAEAGGDFHLYCEMIRERQSRYGERLEFRSVPWTPPAGWEEQDSTQSIQLPKPSPLQTPSAPLT